MTLGGSNVDKGDEKSTRDYKGFEEELLRENNGIKLYQRMMKDNICK